jgi:hypothetical protein
MSKLDLLFSDLIDTDAIEFLKYVVRNIDNFKYTWHPVGFIVIRLGIENNFNYRLHIWPIGRRIPKHPDWPIHNHIFDLDSYVICGELLNRNYSLKLEATKTSQYDLYEVEYYDGGSTISKNSTYISSITYQETLIKSNNSYHIPQREFHETIVESMQLTSTMVRTTIPNGSDKALILGRVDSNRLYDCPNKKINKLEVIAQIRNVIGQIKDEQKKSLTLYKLD